MAETQTNHTYHAPQRDLKHIKGTKVRKRNDGPHCSLGDCLLVCFMKAFPS